MIPWLFLFVTLVGAALVWNVYRPGLGPGPVLGFWGFFLGWLEGELAIHHILWQGVATAGFVAAGALASPVGWIALGVTAVSWIALGVHYARGFAVRRTMEQALALGLGPDYEARIDPELRATLPERVDWKAIAAPFPIRHPGVERIRNIPYARAGSFELRLDLYRPKRSGHDAHASASRPVLFYVHGGAWVIGSKNQQGLPLCYHAAARGWVCVNVNYRLSPHATFPEHLIDLKRALAWVREEGAAFGCDPGFVVTTGGSAGGHLAALLALTANDPALQPGFEDADTSVQGCVPIYGVFDFTPDASGWRRQRLLPFLERHVMKARYDDDPTPFEQASPIHRVRPDAPPFLVVHGAQDTLAPAAEARRFALALRGVSRAPVAYAEIPDAQHAFELFPSLRSDLTRQGIERFLATIWSDHRRGRTGARALEAEEALGGSPLEAPA